MGIRNVAEKDMEQVLFSFGASLDVDTEIYIYIYFFSENVDSLPYFQVHLSYRISLIKSSNNGCNNIWP